MPAPKGNRYAVGNNGGQPPIYKSVEELQTAIESYFQNVPTKTVRYNDNEVEVPVPTITGLTLHLGFCDRQSFYDYEKRPEYSHTIKRARMMIENDYEMQLRTATAGQAGCIFALKNFGWKDKTEVDTNISVSDELFNLVSSSTGPTKTE